MSKIKSKIEFLVILICLCGIWLLMRQNDVTGINTVQETASTLISSDPEKGHDIKISEESSRILASNGLNIEKTLILPKFGGIQIVAAIGTYQQPAVIRFQVLNDNTIRGGYFYLKHRKILQLNGKVEGGLFDLTESFEGKVTGHMRINPFEPNESKWLDPSKEYSGSLVVEYMETLSAEQLTSPVKLWNHDNKHKIGTYWGTEEEIFEVTDNVDVLLLDDRKKMFLNIQVVASNFHMGGFSGILNMTDSKSYEHQSPDCEIKLSLVDDGVLAIAEKCGTCCGARASLSGSFPLKQVEEYQPFGSE